VRIIRQFCQVWDEACFAYLGLCRISTRMASSYVIREIDETSHTLYIEQQGIDTLYGVRSPPYESSAMPTTSEEVCDCWPMKKVQTMFRQIDGLIGSISCHFGELPCQAMEMEAEDSVFPDRHQHQKITCCSYLLFSYYQAHRDEVNRCLSLRRLQRLLSLPLDSSKTAA